MVYQLNVTSATTEEIATFVNQINVAIGGIDGLGEGSTLRSNMDQIWILLCGFLVFWMHAGFSMLEAGSVRHKNAVNILFKNIGTVSIGGIFYFLLGYGFAYGTDNSDSGSYGFIGSGDFALTGFTNADRHSWFFQFAFAATGATIVSGAVAGRINLMSYFACAAFMTAFVYPVVSHWVWSSGGWASAFLDDPSQALFAADGGIGVIDYAGSGVVHMTGGVAAFVGAAILGPRLGRFDADGKPVPMPPHNVIMQALGVFILWFGWYGFNCGSTLAFDGQNAAKVAVTTTLAPSTAVLTGMILSRVLDGHFDIGVALNSALGGLVSITAGCSVVPDWAAIIIGLIGALVYYFSSKLMKLIKIDDPVDAIAVHGWCGIWGLLAVGIFATQEFIVSAYAVDGVGNGSGIQFASQLCLVLAIIGWVTLMMAPFFFALKLAGVLRVSAEMEETGLDVSEHGGQHAFIADPVKASMKKKVTEGSTEISEV